MKTAAALLACALGLLAGGCVTGARLDWPATPIETGVVPGYPAEMRTVHPSLEVFEKAYRERIARARRASRDGSLDVLALSGGGAGGVFGAGALVGWTASGTRPQFEVVTGVSTGSLVAPFAFLGPTWDGKLEEAYTGGLSENLLDSGGIGSLFRVGMYESDRLYELVNRFVTPQMIAAIAAEHRRGRILLVATTNLDTEEPVFWDMGELANGGGEKARKLFVDVLVASSSIPGVFPPVMVEVEGEVGRYDEMHVDGGVTVPFFIAPGIAFLSPGSFDGLKGGNVYVIINGQLESQPQRTPANTVEMVMRSSNLALMRMARSELLLAGAFTRSNGMGYRFTAMPASYPFEGPMNFEQGVMRELFDYAKSCAANGQIWIGQEEAVVLAERGVAARTGDKTLCPAAPAMVGRTGG